MSNIKTLLSERVKAVIGNADQDATVDYVTVSEARIFAQPWFQKMSAHFRQWAGKPPGLGPRQHFELVLTHGADQAVALYEAYREALLESGLADRADERLDAGLRELAKRARLIGAISWDLNDAPRLRPEDFTALGRKRWTAWLPTELHDAADAEAARSGITRSAWAEGVIVAVLNRPKTLKAAKAS